MRYLVLLLLVFSFFSLKAQDCPPGDVILLTQAEVDAYVATFPNCTTINGNLDIGPSNWTTGVTDLSGLSMLTHITGSLRIIEVPQLSNLNGLEQLEEIGGSLIFDLLWQNVLDISALDHPITIGGIIYLDQSFNVGPCTVQAICDHYLLSPDNVISNSGSSCGSLGLICQPPSECPPGDVMINSQADMDYFTANYPNCTQINGDWIMDAPPYTYGWTNIAELPALEHITGNISIRAHTMLSANSFSALTHLGGGVHISAEIEGDFPALENIGGSIIVFDGSNTGAEATGGYPALKYIGGDLSAGGPEGGFFNSDDFPLLERIEGGISGCGHGISHDFSGFDNLRYIGGDIDTQEGNISGMNMLDTIGGNLNFYTCYNVYVPIQITGLNQLKYIGGDLKFNTYHCLQDLSGLTQLETIGGDLDITLQTGFACSTSTDSLTGLGQLRHVGNDLSIFESNLTNIDFLGQLESVGGSLSIRSNSFDNLDALNHAVDIGGELIIEDNWNLSECAVQAVCDHLTDSEPTTIANNLTGCNNTSEVLATCDPMLICPTGDLTLTTQQEIDAFANIPNCTSIPGKLIIRASDPADISNLDALSQLTSTGNGLLIDNTAITNLNGLQNLTTTGYNLVITNNLNLTSLVGLENITSTASHLKIENNDLLTDFSGLDGITSVGEGVLIFGNEALQDFSGLDNLTSIGTLLYVQNNPALTDFSGLELLTTIGGGIRLQSNTALDNITALSNITTIDGYIRVSGHNTLTSLDGLENIDPNSFTDLILTNNTNLAVCSQESICSYLENGGTATINNNASGCNTQSEIEIDCISSCSLLLPIIGVNLPTIPDAIYRAADEVNATGTVPTGGDVNFKAAQTILLDNNFTVEPNANFSAEIKGCSGQ